MINNYKKIVDKFEEDIYKLSVDLIRNVCSDLNKSNKADDLIKKYLKKTDKKVNKKKNNDIKRPKTAYIYFLEDVRPKIAKKYPDDKLGDISKRIGKLWQNLSNKDKEKYDKLAKKDVERFKKDMEKKGVVETDIEQSQTLYELEESNVVVDEDLFSSEGDSSSGYDSSNSNNSNNSNKSLELYSSDESNSNNSFSDIDTDDDEDEDDTIFEESSIQVSNKKKVEKSKKSKK